MRVFLSITAIAAVLAVAFLLLELPTRGSLRGAEQHRVLTRHTRNHAQAGVKRAAALKEKRAEKKKEARRVDRNGKTQPAYLKNDKTKAVKLGSKIKKKVQKKADEKEKEDKAGVAKKANVAEKKAGDLEKAEKVKNKASETAGKKLKKAGKEEDNK
ncbi:expressed unknown protein [Seminavis robusta]|uniref:Uncharacterized protein n=1 Tax=Seminavis robusta TaxID=568900 RepID=A0A9N8E1D6_9STRA|nr:expressed unknown protein [Seminavis robusta]|eukprot:Sro553_g165300.1 n/a (157) ;mRNA; f:22907-23471